MEVYKYKVSVIMAVYNVEPFIREAIDSVIAQDIGFQNIQLILVDDGSPDGSGAICDEYAAKYPDNVFVVHKENGGVSSARNAGLDLAEGEFINFMDPDDKLDSNAASVVWKFFQEHREETDVVSFPMNFFDAKTGSHLLNYKYKQGNRVINLDEEWGNPQCSMSSTFVKADCFDDFRFDQRITQAEDLHLLQKILLQKHTLGVLGDTTYWYRKRSAGEQSAVDSRLMRKDGYIPMLRGVQMDLINYCNSHYGHVPKFVQFTLMYDLQWHIKRKVIPEGILTEREKQEYLSLLLAVLQQIDDDVIDAQSSIHREHKLLAYQLKYGEELTRVVEKDDIVAHAHGKALLRASESVVVLEFFDSQEHTCTLEGVLYKPEWLLGNCRILVKAGYEFYEANAYNNRPASICLGQEVQHYQTFQVQIPLKAEMQNCLEIYCEADGVYMRLKNIRYGRYFPISDKYIHNYYSVQNWILTWKQGEIKLEPRRFGSSLKYEWKLCLELWRTKHKIARNSVLSRLMLHVLRPFKRKPIWLISDRASKADDNGEAFFRYVRENHLEIDARFVINEDCPDYEAMKKIGPVVKKDSYSHKMLHLLSDCIISSHADANFINPFYKSFEPYRNLLANERFIFLQHGIIKDDMSQLFCRSVMNIKGFITAARSEYDSICQPSYEYTKNEVWLTGLPRFDRLYQDSNKWITIMPTWRKKLMGQLNKQSGSWTLALGAETSDYVQFYNSLLNDKRLHEAAQKYGYQLKFLPHPNMQNHWDVFDGNDHVAFLSMETAYRDVYAKSDLVVTDYSSAVFDFAYLHKPVIYAQFDADTFFSGEHNYTKGYFDYERDGFGEVEYDLEGTVARIVEYMKNGCQLKEKYLARIDRFFAFKDKNNCQRVYERILAADII